jgi:hypothetical protein
MYTLRDNQYLPNGLGKPAETYYYLTNDKGQVVDKKTLKPYRGKQRERFAFKNKPEAEKALAKANGEPESMTLKQFEKTVSQETEDKYFDDFARQSRYYGHGVYGWHDIKASDTRNLFLLGVAAREGIHIKKE